MKSVYIVRGSEDGTLGAYSSLKKAYAAACRYVVNGWAFKCEETTPLTAEKKIREDIKIRDYAEIKAGDSYEAYAVIEAHFLL